MADHSLQSLISFLDYLASKGLMPRNTVAGRKAAVGKVLGVLDPEEQADVTQIDVDSAMSRFINLEGKGYTPGSLAVYKSRVVSAISDFQTYNSNPAGFKLGSPQKRQTTGASKSADASANKKREKVVDDSASHRPDHQVAPTANVFPIPIRADLVVRIHGLPFDLTAAEAEKIASVVKAMALATN